MLVVARLCSSELTRILGGSSEEYANSFVKLTGKLSQSQPDPPHPKDPAVLKTLRVIELLRHSVFTMPPCLLRYRPLFEGKHACKTQENRVNTGGGRHSKSLCDCKFTTHGNHERGNRALVILA